MKFNNWGTQGNTYKNRNFGLINDNIEGGVKFMQMHKKIISVLLVIVLMFTSFTFTSTAEETLPELQSSLDSVDYTENSAEELVLPDIIEQNDVQAAEKYEARA